MQTKKRAWRGPNKEHIRQVSSCPGKQYQSVMDLPAAPCLSISRLIERGCVSPSTRFVLYECKKRQVPLIHRAMNGLGINDDRFEIINDDIRLATPSGSYDWVNLDTCCSLSRGLVTFISELKFIDGGELNVWLTYYRSNGAFHEGLKQTFLRTDGMEITQMARRKHPDAFDNCGPTKVVTMMAILLAMRHYDFHVETPADYADQTTRMYFFRLRDIRKVSKPSLPKFFDVFTPVDDYEILKCPPKKPRKLSSEGNISNMCVMVAGGSAAGSKAFLTKQMRQQLRAAPSRGKSVKWVKAGWKSAVSRITTNQILREECFRLIELA